MFPDLKGKLNGLAVPPPPPRSPPPPACLCQVAPRLLVPGSLLVPGLSPPVCACLCRFFLARGPRRYLRKPVSRFVPAREERDERAARVKTRFQPTFTLRCLQSSRIRILNPIRTARAAFRPADRARVSRHSLPGPPSSLGHRPRACRRLSYSPGLAPSCAREGGRDGSEEREEREEKVRGGG